MIDSTDIHSSTKALPSDIDRLRRQARQRFIGAAVLVLIAVIGLPFILDSKPRSISPNIKIDIQKAASNEPVAAETPLQPSPAMASQPEPTAQTSAVPPATTPVPVVAPEVQATPAPTAPAAPAITSGYALQAGSFIDKAKLQAVQAKLDKAGLAHYTQGAISKNGTHHTRIRLGPYATLQEANSAAAKVNRLGIKTIVIKP